MKTMGNIFNLIRNNIKNRTSRIIVENLLNIPYSIIFYFISKRLKLRINKKKYYSSICGIFKDEAPYLKEWIEYHHLVGIEHIYLYNNNSSDNFYEILRPYIEKGFITLIEWPKLHAQMEAYKHCYDNFKKDTNWLAFFDIDEFVCPKIETDINSFLKKYEGYPGILIYWQMFGTNGLVDCDKDKLVIEQYTNSWKHLDGTGKVFISTENYLPTNIYNHWMAFRYKVFKVPVMTEHKKFIFFPQIYTAPKLNTIQLNHYWSKSLNEFLFKIKRGDAASSKNEVYRQKFSFFLAHEQRNISENKVIYRFLIQLKIRLNKISI